MSVLPHCCTARRDCGVSGAKGCVYTGRDRRPPWLPRRNTPGRREGRASIRPANHTSSIRRAQGHLLSTYFPEDLDPTIFLFSERVPTGMKRLRGKDGDFQLPVKRPPKEHINRGRPGVATLTQDADARAARANRPACTTSAGKARPPRPSRELWSHM